MTDNIEIERKFLVSDASVLDGVDGMVIRQGYLSRAPERTVRVRRVGDVGWLTIKSMPTGITRREYEYRIPAEEADELLDELCVGTVIMKERHLIPFEGHTWEVDRFHNPHTGLILAEVELQSEEEEVVLPPWLGREVTHDHRYSNSHLSTHPEEELEP